MKVAILAVCFFFSFLTFAGAGDLYSCIDNDGNEIVTNNPKVRNEKLCIERLL